MDPLLIISSDSHITPPPDAVHDYLETAYQPWFADYTDENDAWLRMLEFLKFPPEVLDVIDPDQAIRTGGDLGWDVSRRLMEMDREGVAGELLLASTHAAATPFFGYANRAYPPDVRHAGTRAYHRWLADFMTEANGRMFAVALSGPCLDMRQSVDDLRWAAAHGFRSISVPGAVYDERHPPLTDSYFEPYWRACAELDMVLSVHASHGRVQGTFMPFIERIKRELGDGATPQQVQHALGSGDHPDSPFAPNIVPQQVLWQLMAGGVFDRYPSLQIAFTEVRCDWVPETLAVLDELFRGGGTPLRKAPSEYWDTNCMAGVSSIKQSEVRLRHEIGVSRMMFGRDYPHAEGTWPNTYDWLRHAFAGVAEDEVRLILGENAIRCYGLDRDHFARIAADVGPLPADVLGSHAVRPELVAHFGKRAGYAKSMEDIDADALRQWCATSPKA
ncbi:MAG TPA: amidohydrolase family protein [Ilumatobacteraceae bacterium]